MMSLDAIVPELRDALDRSGAAVLHAPPGSGKTTRVPLALLESIPGKIIMLEPRRIAAVSAARWMAGLLGEEAGRTVGYRIRFDSQVSGETRIEVVTEGVLTRRIQNDPGLEGVSLVIFDEFHERSIHADLGLALCLDIKSCLREDLKVLVMSATLECARVSTLLGNAPVISVSGQQFHVEERYLPGLEERPSGNAAAAVLRVVKETEGDLLVFLPGAGEIHACAESLESFASAAGLSVHPLYGDLSFSEQERAILPSGKRKVVLATNIAETSLTIEGVRVVIDTGLARVLRFDPSRGMNRLVTATISRASAEQRKGRAGRLAEGWCYRLYSRAAFEAMVVSSPPEILVSDLAPLVLELAAWGITDPGQLSWLDRPPAPAWNEARELLLEMGAVRADGSVTEEGRRIARIPAHPRLGSLLLRAEECGVADLGADLAALLSERDILRGPGRASEKDPDIAPRLGCLRRWRKSRRAEYGADPAALARAEKTAQQLLRLTNSGPGKSATAHEVSLGMLLLRAFPDRIARKREGQDRKFLVVRGRGVTVGTGSALSRAQYLLVLDADLGQKSEGTVYLAAEITEEEIRIVCSQRIVRSRNVVWDEERQRVAASDEERIGAVVLSVKQVLPTPDEAAAVVCTLIRGAPHLLVFSNPAEQFRRRVLLLRSAFPEEPWPDLSIPSLLSSCEEWLSPFLTNVRSLNDFRRADLYGALRQKLSWQQLRLVEERAPETLNVPSGRRAALDYDPDGGPPVLAVKLQEMFGLAETPAIAGGRVLPVIHLLSPAGRPLQITQDLKGFWNTGYAQVRKELRGRYPKHPWPEDPWSAPPTRSVKKKT